MRNLVLLGDNLLIDRVCQPVADWLLRSLELDCFRVARFCTDIAALAWIISQVYGLVPTAKSGLSGTVAFQFTLIVIVLGAMMTVRSIFDRGSRTGRIGQSGLSNPLRTKTLPHRLICALGLINQLVQTIMAPIGLVSVALLTMQGFLMTAVFMGACSNRPQMRRKDSVDSWQPLGFQNR
jgi:hypothetical protein